MNQLALLLDEPRARASDPLTSHQAAAQAKSLQSHHHSVILTCLQMFGSMGKDNIAAHTRLTGVQICRRLHELEALGKIEATGKTVLSTSGRHEREWRRRQCT